MANGRLFFQIAAGLIPVLIFGGLVSDRLKPGPWVREHAWGPSIAGVVVLVLIPVPLYAEVTAITVALGSPATDFNSWLVAGTVAGSTAILSLALAWPWLMEMHRAAPSALERKLLIPAIVVALAALTFQCARLLRSSIELNASNASLARIEKLTRQFETDQTRQDRAMAAMGRPGGNPKFERLRYESAIRASDLTMRLIIEEFKNSTIGGG